MENLKIGTGKHESQIEGLIKSDLKIFHLIEIIMAGEEAKGRRCSVILPYQGPQLLSGEKSFSFSEDCKEVIWN